jgi:hypothetical protein
MNQLSAMASSSIQLDNFCYTKSGQECVCHRLESGYVSGGADFARGCVAIAGILVPIGVMQSGRGLRRRLISEAFQTSAPSAKPVINLHSLKCFNDQTFILCTVYAALNCGIRTRLETCADSRVGVCGMLVTHLDLHPVVC